MPRFLEAKLKKEYPNNPHAVFGTMNAIGAMRGNKETARGRQMEKKHHMDMGHKQVQNRKTHGEKLRHG